MLLPIRSKNPPESFPIATILLIVINCVVFFLTGNGLEIRTSVVETYGLTALNFSPVTLMTSMFLHGDIFHLLGNMWFLYLFGFAVEGRLKTPKFVVLYLLAGFSGDVLHYLLVGQLNPAQPSIGASGAIMGVLGAALFMFPFGQVNFIWSWYFHFQVVTWNIWHVALYYLGLDILFAFLAGGTGGVAHFAHLGGALGGFLVCMAFRPKRDSEAASEARANFAEMKDLSMLRARELELMHEANPNDTHLALQWMVRSLSEPGGVKPQCAQAFQRLMPQIAENEDIRTVGTLFANLYTSPGFVPSSLLLKMAYKLEREKDFLLAMRLFDTVMSSPASTAGDQEAAMMRSAILCETVIGNRQRAIDTYQEIMRRFPMSPMADQARMRLANLTRT